MNKKLLRSVREYKKQSVLAPVLVILEVLMEVLIPLEMAKIIDVGIANGDRAISSSVESSLLQWQCFPCSSAYRPEIWRQLQQQDMRRIYDTIFFIRCRIFPLKISIAFQHQVWSHD